MDPAASPGLQAGVLTVSSVVSLSLVLLVCLRCRRRRKHNIIREETQIYNPQVFHRGGSKFAVVRSKTVTRANQMSHNAAVEQAEEPEYCYTDKEHIYIEPMPLEHHEEDDVHNGGVGCSESPYGNIFPSSDADDSDYENSEFLAEKQGAARFLSDDERSDGRFSSYDNDYENVVAN